MKSYRYSIATFPSKWKSTSCLLATARQRGLTLLELLVTLAVVAIVISIGAPSLSGGLNDSRLRTSANSLQSSLSAARSTAVAKGVVVTVCASTTGQTCAADTESDIDWADGWMVFIDKGTIGTVDAADTDLSSASASDQRVLVQQSVGASVTVVAESNTGGSLNYISFQPTGFTQNANGQFQSGSFLFCDDRGDAAGSKRRVVRIGAAGASRVSEPPDGDGCSG